MMVSVIKEAKKGVDLGEKAEGYKVEVMGSAIKVEVESKEKEEEAKMVEEKLVVIEG